MRKNILIIVIIAAALSQSVGAQESIDLLMRSQLGITQFGSDDEFNIPLMGRSEDLNYKSKFKAALFSLVVPGTGQYYINNFTKTKIFFGIEAGFWLSYYGFRKYSAFKDEAARGWAVFKAGANPDNDDGRYWVKMTYYDNRDRNESPNELGYNQMAPVFEREYAVLFPETPEYYWNWDNIEDRRKYRNLRNQSKTADERGDIIIGLIIANHIISAGEAFLSTIKYNRRLEFSDTGFKFHYAINPSPDNPAVSVCLTKSFD